MVVVGFLAAGFFAVVEDTGAFLMGAFLGAPLPGMAFLVPMGWATMFVVSMWYV